MSSNDHMKGDRLTCRDAIFRGPEESSLSPVGITGAADFCPTSEARRAVIRCGAADGWLENTGATGERKPGRNGPVTERPERSTED